MSKCTTSHEIYNKSEQTPLSEILSKAYSRRAVLKGTGGVMAVGALSSVGLTGCGSDETSNALTDRVTSLGFDSVSAQGKDAFTVPEGYFAQVLAPWGTRLFSHDVQTGTPIQFFQQDGSNTSLDQLNTTGQMHDGMHYYPLNDAEGILCINHEFIMQDTLHEEGFDANDTDDFGRRLAEYVRKEYYAHGVSVVHVRLENSVWNVVLDSQYNRRIHTATEMEVTGAIADTDLLTTKFTAETGKPNATHGTFNNCGNGFTPWGTYLTCEENWTGAFTTEDDIDPVRERYGIQKNNIMFSYHWQTAPIEEEQFAGEFKRWDLTAKGGSAEEDFRNFDAGYGYVVEIDPFSSNAMPAKRSSLGRFRHEDCSYATPVAGKPLVFYSGHDGKFEYVYKFVSEALWDEMDASRNLAHDADRMAIGAKYMDKGTLYVARFDENGKGVWLPLTEEAVTANGQTLGALIGTQAEIIRNTLGAADAMGATPMDRPEWTAVDYSTGFVYLSLTNNDNREQGNPANPRPYNEYGHIVRWKEGETDTEFNWEIFVFGSSSEADSSSINLSGLTEENEFGSADGICFDQRGIFWLQTDGGGTDVDVDDQILAVIPNNLESPAHGEPVINMNNQEQLKRFAVAPKGAESTGITFTPDFRHMFTNVQHPTNWPHSALDASSETPSGENWRPRSSTVVISRYDGGKLGV